MAAGTCRRGLSVVQVGALVALKGYSELPPGSDVAALVVFLWLLYHLGRIWI